MSSTLLMRTVMGPLHHVTIFLPSKAFCSRMMALGHLPLQYPIHSSQMRANHVYLLVPKISTRDVMVFLEHQDLLAPFLLVKLFKVPPRLSSMVITKFPGVTVTSSSSSTGVEAFQQLLKLVSVVPCAVTTPCSCKGRLPWRQWLNSK